MTESPQKTVLHHSPHPSPSPSPAPHLLGLLALALVVYQPWTSVPFPLVDYSEFLRPLREGETFVGGLDRVIDYYHSHGRSSYLAYVQLALNWTLFGARPTAWNLSVFLFAAAAAAAAWFVLVRIGNRMLPATLAVALLIVATPAVPAWLRPTGEPLALLFLACALGIAFHYQESSDWRPRAAVMLVLLLGIGLAKDLLTPLVILPIIVGCCWHGRLRAPRLSERNLWLVMGGTVVLLVLAALIFSVISKRSAGAYTESYSFRNIAPPEVIGTFWQVVLPRSRSSASQPLTLGHLISNSLFGLLVLGGLLMRMKSAEKQVALHELNVWLALLLLGALLYAPLPWFSAFYAFPFFLGSVAIYARALTALEQKSILIRMVARGGALVVLLLCGINAYNVAREETATRRLHGQLSMTFRTLQPADSMVVERPAVNEWEWAQRSALIRRNAIDNGDLPENAPPARDVLCGASKPLAGTRLIVINYPTQCGDLAYPARQLTQRYWVLSPLPVRRQLRLEVALLAPSAAQSSPRSRPQ